MRAKSFFIGMLLLSAIVQGLPAQNEKTVTSKVTEATVFFKGAELTHTASVLLEKGKNEVCVEGLSPVVDVNSLKIKTTNNVAVASFDFSIDYLSKPEEQISAKLKNLKDSIKTHKTELEKININLKINAELLTQLQKSISKSTSGSEKGLTLDELMRTMDFYKSKSEQIEIQQLKLNDQKVELEKILQKLQAQIDRENSKDNNTSGVIHLTLMAPIAANCTVTITYFTASAGWIPYFDLTVISTDRPIAISQKSRVYQTTGFDWDKVKLTLSTGTPSSGKIAPLFSAWFLKEQSFPVFRNREILTQNSFSYDLKESIIIEPEEVPLPAPTGVDDFVTESDNVLNIVYAIDLPYSIPGNGKAQNIELQTKETKAEYKYYCVPKLDNSTYVLAEISDWEKLELLSGNANVTFDGVYIGATCIDANSTHEKLSLTLGTDDRISVKREKMQDFSVTKFLGNDVQQTFTYKITVKNNQNRKIKMVLKDQYPISTQKKIEVTLLKETTRWTVNKEEVGVITWEEDFEAGETKTYQLSYSVKYPKEMRLNL